MDSRILFKVKNRSLTKEEYTILLKSSPFKFGKKEKKRKESKRLRSV